MLEWSSCLESGKLPKGVLTDYDMILAADVVYGPGKGSSSLSLLSYSFHSPSPTLLFPSPPFASLLPLYTCINAIKIDLAVMVVRMLELLLKLKRDSLVFISSTIRNEDTFQLFKDTLDSAYVIVPFPLSSPTNDPFSSPSAVSAERKAMLEVAVMDTTTIPQLFEYERNQMLFKIKLKQ